MGLPPLEIPAKEAEKKAEEDKAAAVIEEQLPAYSVPISSSSSTTTDAPLISAVPPVSPLASAFASKLKADRDTVPPTDATPATVPTPTAAQPKSAVAAALASRLAASRPAASSSSSSTSTPPPPPHRTFINPPPQPHCAYFTPVGSEGEDEIAAHVSSSALPQPQPILAPGQLPGTRIITTSVSATAAHQQLGEELAFLHRAAPRILPNIRNQKPKAGDTVVAVCSRVDGKDGGTVYVAANKDEGGAASRVARVLQLAREYEGKDLNGDHGLLASLDEVLKWNIVKFTEKTGKEQFEEDLLSLLALISEDPFKSRWAARISIFAQLYTEMCSYPDWETAKGTSRYRTLLATLPTIITVQSTSVTFTPSPWQEVATRNDLSAANIKKIERRMCKYPKTVEDALMHCELALLTYLAEL
ncbi:hypothetical protein BDK51DRAFT_39180 [Blyttiomyces helicus]|uniref:Uncharacterized protein n=1 Tax=Blyttiomyces helicus TaxID=388810 RepID=A0A4P9W8A8_9FUNG|nr:hypothetical protein BDK51DRAFT_39180 [Blyttiomyces helicus]|eukprot:RKO86396.1 hypothetical protein BDK51DRAFT_39180 [Blyttiomyces helicus]